MKLIILCFFTNSVNIKNFITGIGKTIANAELNIRNNGKIIYVEFILTLPTFIISIIKFKFNRIYKINK